MSVDSSSFYDNTSVDGASISAEVGNGTLEVVNSTFDEPNGENAPLFAVHVGTENSLAPTVTIAHSTVVGEGGIQVEVDSDDPTFAGDVSVSHTIISARNAPAIVVGGSGSPTVEWSLISAASPASLGLGPLLNNGGPTPTMMLDESSQALNAGDPDFSGVAFDQCGAGFDRVSGGTIDIGAVERQVGAGLVDTGAQDAGLLAAGGAGILLLGVAALWRRRLVLGGNCQ